MFSLPSFWLEFSLLTIDLALRLLMSVALVSCDRPTYGSRCLEWSFDQTLTVVSAFPHSFVSSPNSSSDGPTRPSNAVFACLCICFLRCCLSMNAFFAFQHFLVFSPFLKDCTRFAWFCQVVFIGVYENALSYDSNAEENIHSHIRIPCIIIEKCTVIIMASRRNYLLRLDVRFIAKEETDFRLCHEHGCFMTFFTASEINSFDGTQFSHTPNLSSYETGGSAYAEMALNPRFRFSQNGLSLLSKRRNSQDSQLMLHSKSIFLSFFCFLPLPQENLGRHRRLTSMRSSMCCGRSTTTGHHSTGLARLTGRTSQNSLESRTCRST